MHRTITSCLFVFHAAWFLGGPYYYCHSLYTNHYLRSARDRTTGISPLSNERIIFVID